MDHGSLHQKFREFECKLRKWKELRFGFGEGRGPSKRSSSQDPRKVNGSATSSPCRAQLQPIPLGCRTSPMERRPILGLALPLSAGGSQNQALNPDQAELERKYNEVTKDSGKITIMGNRYTVRWEELEGSFISDIGNGSCGHVSKYKYNDYVMAVKTMPRSNNPEENKRIIMDLAVVTRTGDCPNIVRCYGYFICQTSVRICMETMATCLDRLLKRIKIPFPEPIIGKVAVDVVTALDYLKTKHNVIHRDVKPSNILIDWDGVVKMCDFGISGFLVESIAHSVQAGCPPYMAPERLSQDNVNSLLHLPREEVDIFQFDKSNYDIRSDVWSLGISLVELARGRFPYNATSEFEVLAAIIDKPPPILHSAEGFSPALCDFVEKCLQKTVNLRPKYQELLKHPFIVASRAADTDVGEWLSEMLADNDMEM